MLPLHATRPFSTRRGSMALALRRLTADDHRRAETAALSTRLFESRARYTAYLETLLPFYEAIELGLVARLDPRAHPALEGLAMHARRKAPLLARDLQVLGSSYAGAREEPALPEIRATADALGVAYVLEGKTLGARFLLREAQARLGITGAHDGAAFLSGYGESTGPRWNAYRTALEAFVASRGCRTAIVSAAQATFEAFIRTVTVVAF